MKEIIVLFKTHLDIGFTDSAEKVLRNYCDSYIPRAIETALRLRDTDTPFVWTTGSYLIYQYLQRSSGIKRSEMEKAIREGFVSWHGLPFTTHTELMNEELFLYGVSLSRKLDQLFGIRTIAAKMTDVPGHTIQMVPLLVQNGIQFLYIGVNEACHMPKVPELFRWKSSGGEEILVMYNSGYGKFTVFANGEKAVYFAHTNDNLGPQSVEEIKCLYAELRFKYPEAYIHAGNLNDIANMVSGERDSLPVISWEIGDTWIHGTGSDPAKIFWYREMLRTAMKCDSEVKEKVFSHLLLIPEHTWGLDEKTYMPDQDCFSRDRFQRLRQTEGAKRMEASWLEQREYIWKAVDEIPFYLQKQVRERLKEYKRKETDIEGWEQLQHFDSEQIVCGWHISFQENGAICRLEKNGIRISDHSHLLGLLFYELFSEAEYDRYLEHYLIARPEWAIEDNKKIGMRSAVSQYQKVYATCNEIYQRENTFLIRLSFPKEIVLAYGCPEKAEYTIRFTEKELFFDLAWYQKAACRCAEAIWFSMEPLSRLESVSKLGKPVDLNQVCSYGGRRIHATDGRIRYNNIEIQALDSCLLSAGGAALLNCENKIPKETLHPDRVDYNLYNNIWGTNFPMWYEEDARFRFTVKLLYAEASGQEVPYRHIPDC